ncbi:MAG: Nucleolar protein 16 [Vezdaea aestivalis]|nr:MAG: Nucleolar protein 16 [Vezdaea aestivalis]
MGRELQKKKNRSSIPKIRQKPKSKKISVRGNAIVAANWDKHQTLRQNYDRLGLTPRLNAPTGGIERNATNLIKAKKIDPLAIGSSVSQVLVPREVEVERDASGNIVRVLQRNEAKPNPLGDPLNDLDDDGEDNVDSVGLSANSVTNVVARLEEQARNEAPKRTRTQSSRETEWVARLVDKYGDNYSRMVMDRQLNPMQQSEGDLRKRIRRWKTADASQ